MDYLIRFIVSNATNSSHLSVIPSILAQQTGGNLPSIA
jgi:hypothetical protein